MTLLTPAKARAYVYNGDWIAECPADGCANAEYLFKNGQRVPQFWCSYCRQIADIEWAKDEAEIMAVLAKRPVPSTRNWYPVDHDVAVRANIPHGQTVQQLIDENHEHGVV